MMYRLLFVISSILLISCGEDNEINDVELLFPHNNKVYALDLKNGKLNLVHNIDERYDVKKIYPLYGSDRYLVELIKPAGNEICELDVASNELSFVAKGSNLMEGDHDEFFFLETNDYYGATLSSISTLGMSQWKAKEVGAIKSGRYISVYDSKINHIYFANMSDMESVYYYDRASRFIAETDDKCFPVFFRPVSEEIICSSRNRKDYYFKVGSKRIEGIDGMPIYYDEINDAFVVVKPSITNHSVGIYNFNSRKTDWLWKGIFPDGGFIREVTH